MSARRSALPDGLRVSAAIERAYRWFGGDGGQDGSVVIVRATRKLLHRLGPDTLAAEEESTTLLGDWYATLLPWRPRQVALLVSEHTLLPVMMPLAPAATLLDRFPDHLGAVLQAHRVPKLLIASELAHMRERRVWPTANRSIVGSVTEFAHLADAYRAEEPVPRLP
jgi:hypothetical protein